MADEPRPPELIEAERLKMEAERIRLLAEAEKFAADTRKANAEAETAEAVAAITKIEAERENHRREEELASNKHHLFYAFSSEVSANSVSTCIAQLTIWMRTRPGEPIEIQFLSPGGSVIHGMALWDFIQTVRAAGHHVTTSAIGYAASMASILLQAGDKRVMGKESYLLIHEISLGAGGKIGDIEDTMDWAKTIMDRVANIFASRSKMTKRQILSAMKRKDFWVDSEQALKLGLVDEIR
jgi:ATP-dependent Clp endopeptidase proteolytic subunit ClpP